MKPKTKKALIQFIVLFFVVNTGYLLFHIKRVSCYRTEGILALVLNELVAWNLTEAAIPIVNGTIILKPWTPIVTGSGSRESIRGIDNTSGRSVIDVELLGNKLNNRISFFLSDGMIRELESKKEPQRITFEGIDFEISSFTFEYDEEKREFVLRQLIASKFNEIRLKDNTIIYPVNNGSGHFFFHPTWTTKIPKEDGYDFYNTWHMDADYETCVLKAYNPIWDREKELISIEFWPGWGGVTVYYEGGIIEPQYDLFNLEEANSKIVP
ncbi:MAG: hypothetical protein LBK05_04535 [Treponema sp.]|jgi:hypothetical protein|nr:hypothetical protein [Treponema sp.]